MRAFFGLLIICLVLGAVGVLSTMLSVLWWFGVVLLVSLALVMAWVIGIVVQSFIRAWRELEEEERQRSLAEPHRAAGCGPGGAPLVEVL